MIFVKIGHYTINPEYIILIEWGQTPYEKTRVTFGVTRGAQELLSIQLSAYEAGELRSALAEFTI